MIACVLIPHFAAHVQRQADPTLADVPLLLVKYGAKRSKVLAVSAEAEAFGAAAGMALSRARGTCPAARQIAYDDAQMQEGCDRLLQTLWHYSHRVEVDAAAYPQTGVFYLDLGSLRAEDARYLGEDLQRAVREQFKTEASVGLAGGKFPAHIAAYGHPRGVTLVPRHEEAAFVAPYPISLLPMGKETARRLDLLWLKEIGQLAALPREAVIGQFGREGKLLYALAQGLDSRPVKPRQMPKSETVSRAFDSPLRDHTRIAVVLHHLADDLAQRLDKRGSALQEIALVVHLEGGGVQTERLYLLIPTAGAAGIARTLQQLLARLTLSAGIARLEVCATQLVPNIPKQLELFTRRAERAQIINLAHTLAARHGHCFYEAAAEERGSLLPERRFRLRRLDAPTSEAS